MSDRIDEDVQQSDLIHEQLRESPIQRWILLDGNRYLLSGLLSAFVFTTCVGVGFTGYLPVTDPDTATALIGSIIGGTLPFITIVLAINQLVLSQELGWTGDLQERFEDMVNFRRQVEDAAGTPLSPAAPADFLQLIVQAVIDSANDVESGVEQIDDPQLISTVEHLVDAVTSEGEIVTTTLENAQFGTFDALSAVLGRFNGAHLYVARSIRAYNSEELPDETLDSLTSLIELLGYLAVARQTFKTLYMQHELAFLSKLLLYVGFPTLLGGGIFMMGYPGVIETVTNPTLLVLMISLAVTFVFLPFIVLLVYTLRIATIASRTADFGPFVPRVSFDD